jgi:hypothetical protein
MTFHDWAPQILRQFPSKLCQNFTSGISQKLMASTKFLALNGSDLKLAFSLPGLASPIESNHVAPGGLCAAQHARPVERTRRGLGKEAENMNRLHALPENQDVADYDRKTHKYARDLKQAMGGFNCHILYDMTRTIESKFGVECSRDSRRSERLMVKWLHQRLELVSRIVSQPPDSPTVKDNSVPPHALPAEDRPASPDPEEDRTGFGRWFDCKTFSDYENNDQDFDPLI